MPGDRSQRTEKATAKKLQEARKDGMIARSPELSGWGMVLLATLLVPTLVRKGYALTARLLAQGSDAMAQPSASADLRLLGAGLSGYFDTLLPVAGAFVAVAVVVGLLQTRGTLSPGALRPKVSHLNPIAGLRNLWSPQSAWQTAKSVLRVGLLALVGYRAIQGVLSPLLGQGAMDLLSSWALAERTALSVTRTVAAVSLGIALADYVFQRRRMARQLKMTKQEVKDEVRQYDGNPIVKREIRRRARSLSRKRMIAAIASADALVVNPTHVAVALKYDPGSGAPRVVAKGADELAARLRLEAEIHEVPLVRDVPLARALYGACDLGQEIPPELYEAVAKLLTFLYSLRASGRLRRIDGGAHAPLASFLPGAGRADSPVDSPGEGAPGDAAADGVPAPAGV